MRAVLRHPLLDAAFKDLVLTLPTENYLAEQLTPVDPPRIHAARESMLRQLAAALRADTATEAIPIISASFERFKEEKANAHAGSRR